MRLAVQTQLSDAEAEIISLEDELASGRRERDLLQKRISELEVRGRVETDQARRATEDLRYSEVFREELRQENLEGFIAGFRNCVTQVRRMCPGVDFSGLRPRTVGPMLEGRTVLSSDSDLRGDASGAVPGGPSEAADF